jgi:dolichol-phosphate mannosyltransferase
MRVWWVLPVFNEVENLEPLCASIAKSSADSGLACTIVAVDDGSHDGSGAKLNDLALSCAIEIITHSRNRGLGETIRDGFEFAADRADDEDIIVRTDADNTHDPTYLASLIAALEAGADVAIASRFPAGGGQVGVATDRSAISSIANLMFRLCFPVGMRLREYTCGYRAYRASIVKRALAHYGNNFVQMRGLGFCCTVEKLLKLHLVGAKLVEVPFVLHYDRKRGASKMSFNVTTFGYMVMVVLYNWPWGGWRSAAPRSKHQ